MAEQQMASPQSFTAGFFEKNAVFQEERLLPVLQTGISGMKYHLDLESPETQALLASLTPGTELLLFRDTDNEHDKWAVSVFTKEEIQVGYISRFKNETIARLMDLGKSFRAIVDEKPDPPADPTTARRTISPTEQYDQIPFTVYMVED